MRVVPILCCCLAVLAVSPPSSAQESEPALVVLTETGAERDGLPVFARHPEPEAAAEGLGRGLSGTVLRVYALVQEFRRRQEGVPPEPAYVLLSSRQGGFAREGFYLGEVEKRSAGYVDVHRDWPISGTFGSIDQIVPHELAHVLRRQLVGELEDGGTNQVHALGVRTDRVVAFNEGFAEHLQAVAFDESPDVPAMRELAEDATRMPAVLQRLDAYRRELTARAAFAPPMRMAFIAWYSNDEDVLRYHGVRENLFAREPRIPERLLRTGDPYPAYLVESVLPGAADGDPKSLSRMLASEGVVAALFYRWAMDERIRAASAPAGLYEQFGVAREDITGLENAYLKLMEVFYRAKPQSALAVVDSYRQRFPAEAAWVEEVADEVFLGHELVAPTQLWLANREFETGTTLFDQYRGLPRTHTFDLNAASIADLVGVPGVDLELARTIQREAPYATITELATVGGVSPDLGARFRAMEADMAVLRAELADEAETLSINTILMPLVRRLLLVLTIAWIAAALLHRAVRRRPAEPPLRWLRCTLNGLATALTALGTGWLLGGLAAVGSVALLFGLPAAGWAVRRTAAGGDLAGAWPSLLAWPLAALPAAVMVTPLL